MKTVIASLLILFAGTYCFCQSVATDGIGAWQKLQPPSIITPVNGTTSFSILVGFTITSTLFASNVPGELHVSSDWQVSTGPQGSGTIVMSSMGDTSNKTSYSVLVGILATNTDYYFRVRYHSTNYVSMWSNDSEISTGTIL